MVTTSTCICLEKKRWESRKNNITVNHALFDYSFPNQPKEWKHRPAAEDFNWVRKPWILVYFYFLFFTNVQLVVSSLSWISANKERT